MRPFELLRPATASEAAQAARQPGAKVIAGGTNLVDLMKLDIERPSTLIDLSRALPAGVRSGRLGLELGALATNTEVACDARVRHKYPMLARAILAGASGQIRNKATVGGNLLQRTRCLYFYDIDKACNKRAPGSGCSALQGDARGSAIFGRLPDCIAVHPSDMAVGLAAMDATVHTVNDAGRQRHLPVEALYRTGAAHRDTMLESGELITHVQIPNATSRRETYRKVRDRASFAFALVSLAAVLRVREGRVHGVRLAFGGVAHGPWRARDAEAVLEGERLTPGLLEKAATAAFAQAEAESEAAFKIRLGERLLKATVASLARGGARA